MTTRLAPSEYLFAYLLERALEKSYSVLISAFSTLVSLPFFIFTPFSYRRFARTDNSNCFLFICENHYQNPKSFRQSHDDKSCFNDRMVWIVDNLTQRIAKDSRRFQK